MISIVFCLQRSRRESGNRMKACLGTVGHSPNKFCRINHCGPLSNVGHFKLYCLSGKRRVREKVVVVVVVVVDLCQLKFQRIVPLDTNKRLLVTTRTSMAATTSEFFVLWLFASREEFNFKGKTTRSEFPLSHRIYV